MKQNKQEQETATVAYMIHYYCHKKHGSKHRCKHCEELYQYAILRIQCCPFMHTKTFCSACKVHCYKAEKREQICQVMRYSGPRMLLHKPIMAIRHILIERKEKKIL